MEQELHPPNIKVLMYHRILKERPDRLTNWHYVTVEDFKKQMKIIQKLGYTTITFYDYKLYLEGELTLPKRPIIITFDDGYSDIFENAIPVLQEMNMTAVIFAMGNRELKKFYWDTDEDNVVSLLASNEQLRSASQNGFEIGSHSMNHIDLSTITNEDAYDEITRSKRRIESVIGETVHTFAYPYGSVNERIRNIVKETSYSFACGVFTGPPHFDGDRYDFRRISIKQNTGIIRFLLRLKTPYEYIHWLYSKIRHPEQLIKENAEKLKSKKEAVTTFF